MKIKELDDFHEARYSGSIPKWFCDLEFVGGYIEGGYQGEVRVTGKDADNYYTLYYSYGSCSYCDTWEAQGLTSQEIKDEIEKSIIEYSPDEYGELKERLEARW